jgi:hypothetical protein
MWVGNECMAEGLLAGKFWTFDTGLVALQRQSPLAIFQFPFRHTRDRFDM